MVTISLKWWPFAKKIVTIFFKKPWPLFRKWWPFLKNGHHFEMVAIWNCDHFLKKWWPFCKMVTIFPNGDHFSELVTISGSEHHRGALFQSLHGPICPKGLGAYMFYKWFVRTLTSKHFAPIPYFDQWIARTPMQMKVCVRSYPLKICAHQHL